MNTRVLGRTGLVVSAIGFGAWAVGGNDHGNSYGTTDDETSRRAIRKAVGLGCTFFDTADVYGHGHSEELLGEVLSECSEQTCVATKGGANFSGWGRGQGLDFRPEYIRFACTESLRRLRRDCIDLYQLHNPSLDEIAAGSIFDMLDDLRSEGKIRFYGLSIHRSEEGLAAIEDGRPQTLQVVYNLADQRPARRLFPAAKAAGAGIIARESLWNGFRQDAGGAGFRGGRHSGELAERTPDGASPIGGDAALPRTRWGANAGASRAALRAGQRRGVGGHPRRQDARAGC
ncbi:MAG TPA: aldo/keto reductase [Chloroflexota bacterium]|nr:aldo/keto reductase [Chloroflexota bacterium]